MLDSIRNIFSIPDLRRRVIFTLLMLAVYRIGAQIPNPGISGEALIELWEQQKGTILGMVDLFSGGNMSRMTIFASRHHALYQRLHHPAVAAGGVALSGAVVKRR